MYSTDTGALKTSLASSVAQFYQAPSLPSLLVPGQFFSFSPHADSFLWSGRCTLVVASSLLPRLFRFLYGGFEAVDMMCMVRFDV